MEYIFKILRYDPSNDEHPYFQEFLYQTEKPKSILEALMDIRNEQDCTLAFRYSCREAICGSCAMVINGRFDLACRTMIKSIRSSYIVIEPLPNLEIQKDLVVDMEPFWEALRKIEPFLYPQEELLENERVEKVLSPHPGIDAGADKAGCPGQQIGLCHPDK